LLRDRKIFVLKTHGSHDKITHGHTSPLHRHSSHLKPIVSPHACLARRYVLVVAAVVVSPPKRPTAPPFSLSRYITCTHAHSHSHEHQHGHVEPTTLWNAGASEPPQRLAMAGAPPRQAPFRPSQACRDPKTPRRAPPRRRTCAARSHARRRPLGFLVAFATPGRPCMVVTEVAYCRTD